MGCAASKRIDVAEDVYRPPPTSIAVFDILSIEEPWLKSDGHHLQQDENEESITKHVVPDHILAKLNAIEDAPRTWEEVSKDLEDIKPNLSTPPARPPVPKSNPPAQGNLAGNNKALVHRNGPFHTLEDLEVKKTDLAPKVKTQLKNYDSVNPDSIGSGQETATGGGSKPVKENIFIIRDKLEREKEGKAPLLVKRDPLSDYPEITPPGGSESVVIYTTSLGGVRRTFEDCNMLRSILEYHRVVFDERDVSLHGEFLHELREILGEVACVPRMFVKGRYIGGVEEVVSLNETGRLGRILNWTRVERGVGRLGCEGCGGARFLPCLDCGGSCKIVVGDVRDRCPSCNENGLILCPACSASYITV